MRVILLYTSSLLFQDECYFTIDNKLKISDRKITSDTNNKRLNIMIIQGLSLNGMIGLTYVKMFYFTLYTIYNIFDSEISYHISD